MGTESFASSAALFPPVCPVQSSPSEEGSPPDGGGALPLFSPSSLQSWLLLCCQVVNGGLRDKPGTSRDHYHTCYCLSGLSIAQHGDPGAPYDLHGNLDNILERCALRVSGNKDGEVALRCVVCLPIRAKLGAGEGEALDACVRLLCFDSSGRDLRCVWYRRTNPVYNVVESCCERAREFFSVPL